jgi:CheY-like chemotaxis protein
MHTTSARTTDAHSNNSKHPFCVLLVEDDYDLAHLILVGLEHARFEAHYAPDMDSALQTLHVHELHLIIIDLGLPNAQAPSLCRTVRQTSNMPLILTGANCNVSTQVQAFHLGADDYVGHPCDPRLLVGRTAALLRRSYHYSQPRPMTAQSGTAQRAGALHNISAGTPLAMHPTAPLDHSFPLHRGVMSHPQTKLPQGWATCDTCDYIGPLEKFAHPSSKAGVAGFHTVLCCPNCQHEDIARFTIG